MASLKVRILLGYGGMVVLSAAALLSLWWRQFVAAGVLILIEQIFAGFFAYYIARTVVHPLRDLSRSAGAMHEPPPSSGALADRNDELGELARSIEWTAKANRDQLSMEHQQRTRAQELARAVIDSLPHPVALLSPEGRVELLNAQAAMIGLAAGQDVNDSPHKWLPPLVKQVLATGIETGSGAHGLDSGQGKAYVQIFDRGQELFFLPTLTPIRDATGAITGLTLVLLDVTGQRQVSEARQGLLSTMSHQLKTPLTSIQMSIYLLMEDAAKRLTPRERELLQAARDDAERLYKIIEEVLATARK